MSERSVEVLEAKLDILIEDFQRLREYDRRHIKELYEHINKCNIEIAKMKTVMSWYKKLTWMVGGIISSIIIYKLKGV